MTVAIDTITSVQHSYLSQSVIVSLANLPFIPRHRRAVVLQLGGVKFNGALYIGGNFAVQGLATLHVGSGCFINHSCYFDTVADITLGSGVFVADHVRILTGSHEIGPSKQRASTLTAQPVRIGDGTWIGSGATIMPGVTVGNGVIIGANATVTRDCEPDSVYVGSPAKLLRALD